MRVVVAPDEVIHTNRMTGHDTQLVVFKGGVELTPEISARRHGEIRGSLFACPIGSVVEALEHMSQPTGLEFTANKLEPGVTLGDAGANELRYGGDDGAMDHRVANDSASGRPPMGWESHIRRTATEHMHSE